jgi:hypothetical protein
VSASFKPEFTRISCFLHATALRITGSFIIAVKLSDDAVRYKRVEKITPRITRNLYSQEMLFVV